jgi:hypothetical protein
LMADEGEVGAAVAGAMSCPGALGGTAHSRAALRNT